MYTKALSISDQEPDMQRFYYLPKELKPEIETSIGISSVSLSYNYS